MTHWSVWVLPIMTKIYISGTAAIPFTININSIIRHSISTTTKITQSATPLCFQAAYTKKKNSSDLKTKDERATVMDCRHPATYITHCVTHFPPKIFIQIISSANTSESMVQKWVVCKVWLRMGERALSYHDWHFSGWKSIHKASWWEIKAGFGDGIDMTVTVMLQQFFWENKSRSVNIVTWPKPHTGISTHLYCH